MNKVDIAHLIATHVPKKGTVLENINDVSALPHEFMPPDEGRGTTQWDVFVPIDRRASFEQALDAFMQEEMRFIKVGNEKPIQRANYRIVPQFAEEQVGDLKEIGYPLSYQIFFATNDVQAIKAKADEVITKTAGAEISDANTQGLAAPEDKKRLTR